VLEKCTVPADGCLVCYSVPIPTFRSKEEKERAERLAEQHAREIERGECYRQRQEAENNPFMDEETKYSSVIRDEERKERSLDAPPPAKPPTTASNK
jgi:hypothetical protein